MATAPKLSNSQRRLMGRVKRILADEPGVRLADWRPEPRVNGRVTVSARPLWPGAPKRVRFAVAAEPGHVAFCGDYRAGTQQWGLLKPDGSGLVSRIFHPNPNAN